ncbi:hypothetical protein [Egbenema bharatensis]|uniref:hypothetical protein n=1 Tax=Egbenema bharatensis TaxID=3463334 RepID=UPI003A8560B9
MKAVELKFLLKLLGESGYRAPISKLNPNKQTRAAERDNLCRELTKRGIVDHVREVKQFKIEAAGKALLKQDVSQLPLTESQWMALKACETKTARPGDLSKILASDRQSVIQDVETKGLIKAEKVQIGEVWLTDLGQEYLAREYEPTGTPTISLSLLGNYLQFMRKRLQGGGEYRPSEQLSPQKKTMQLLDDEAVLQKVRELDQELNTDNYLPIFYLRQALQPPFSRDELDQVLYRLQSADRIELSTLQEGRQYTAEQIDAGIPQPLGGALFFIEVID